MDDVSLMQIFDSAASLDHESSDLGHGKVFALLDGVGKGTIFAKLKDNEGASFEREGSVEFDDIGMR